MHAKYHSTSLNSLAAAAAAVIEIAVTIGQRILIEAHNAVLTPLVAVNGFV